MLSSKGRPRGADGRRDYRAGDGRHSLSPARRLRALDLRFPDAPDSLIAAHVVRELYAGTPCSCSRHRRSVAQAAAQRFGIYGFLRKDHNVDHVVSALEVITAGGMVFDPLLSRPVPAEERAHKLCLLLTPREKEVLQRIVTGQSPIQMSHGMNISTSTVRSYVKDVLASWRHRRLEAAFRATSENLLADQGTRPLLCLLWSSSTRN